MKALVILILVATLCGCAVPKQATQSGRSVMTRYEGEKNLDEAVRLLEKGDSAGAARMLRPITTGKSMRGVTDEALFRLALLSLKPDTERPVSRRGHSLLKRLKREYPSSPWSLQAAQLMELIEVAEDLRQQNRNLKELKTTNESLAKSLKDARAANEALSKEIKELNSSIEQLKKLDLELEQKSR